MTTDHQVQVDAAREDAAREDAARDHFNEWYDKQQMPQLLARVDPQQDAFNAFEEGFRLASAPPAPADSEMALKALDGIDLAVSATPGLTVVQFGEALAVIGRYSKTIRDSLGSDASMLRHLLARIHGDGGHYVDEHGIKKAFDDADSLIAEWRCNKRTPRPVPADLREIENLFDKAAGADEETHIRFARLLEKHHGIGA